MVSVKRVTKEALQSREEMTKNLTAIYIIINGMKKVNRYDYSPFHIHTT